MPSQTAAIASLSLCAAAVAAAAAWAAYLALRRAAPSSPGPHVTVTGIFIYPVKGLRGVSVPAAQPLSLIHI